MLLHEQYEAEHCGRSANRTVHFSFSVADARADAFVHFFCHLVALHPLRWVGGSDKVMRVHTSQNFVFGLSHIWQVELFSPRDLLRYSKQARHPVLTANSRPLVGAVIGFGGGLVCMCVFVFVFVFVCVCVCVCVFVFVCFQRFRQFVLPCCPSSSPSSAA